MKHFKQQAYERLYDKATGREFSNMTFDECTFFNCVCATSPDPKLRLGIRNIELTNCSANSCSFFGTIIEDVVVNGLKTSGILDCEGAVFKHVTLRGPIGTIMISDFSSIHLSPEELEIYEQENSKYYETVDWALDISEAQFRDFTIRSVPARLVRRDPATQIIVTRENLLNVKWKKLKCVQSRWGTQFQMFLESNRDDMILVANMRSKESKQWLEDFKELRDAGVAEPD